MKKINDTVFEQVLEMRDNGASTAEIFAKFPAEKSAIAEFLEFENFLHSQKNSAAPSKKSLQKTIDQIFPRKKFWGDWGYFFRKIFGKKFLTVALPTFAFLIFFGNFFPEKNYDSEKIAKKYETEISAKMQEFYRLKEKLEKIKKEKNVTFFTKKFKI